MTRIRDGVNTVPDLLKQLDSDPDNADLLMTLAQKFETMSGLKAAMSYWEILFSLENVEPLMHSTAALKMALFHSTENNDPETLVSFINNETSTEVLPQAFNALKNYYRTAKDTVNEADVYRRYVDFMSSIDRVDSGFLNGYAWRMTELNLNLENALERISQGIDLFTGEEKAREKAQTMDTKGEVLWKLGRIDEAVAIMDECIGLQPEDTYYQEQKTKFQTPS